MGLHSYQGSGYTYLNVTSGKLVQAHKSATPETEERVNKAGKLVYEQKHDFLIGSITGLETKEDNYGKKWLFNVEDEDGAKFQLQMPYSGRYSTSMLKALPNIDLSKQVKIFPWEMQDSKDAAKKISGITLYQQAEGSDKWDKIPPAYTREDPNGLPEMKQVKIKGKLTWDDQEMCEFLENAAKNKIKNHLDRNHGKVSSKPMTSQQKNEEAPF